MNNDAMSKDVQEYLDRWSTWTGHDATSTAKLALELVNRFGINYDQAIELIQQHRKERR